MKLDVIILAAGKGTRMRSTLPKVLHKLAGTPLLGHVCNAARALSPAHIHVVYGHGGEAVPAAITGDDLNWVEQTEQLGTGHAVNQAMPEVDDDAVVLVLYGDVPLLDVATLRNLVARMDSSPLALLTVELDNAGSYGRIVRSADKRVVRIVEANDANESELQINEINTGILAARGADLRRWLGTIGNDNSQGEYYLTDVVALAVAEGASVADVIAPSERESLGVNSKQDLAYVERLYQQDIAADCMAAGLTLHDPARFDVRGCFSFGQDCEIDINVIVEGEVRLGDNVRVGPNTLLRDCVIEDGVHIDANCIIDSARAGAGSRVGPFARLRPGANLSSAVHIGNFVEVKNANVGVGSKANHLAYIGDSDVGDGVNIGAGSITANYDGANKHRTTIEDRASIGSNCVLVAPVKVGAGATIGAGSTIGKNAPAEELTLTRARQVTIKGWSRPVKKQ